MAKTKPTKAAVKGKKPAPKAAASAKSVAKPAKKPVKPVKAAKKPAKPVAKAMPKKSVPPVKKVAKAAKPVKPAKAVKAAKPAKAAAKPAPQKAKAKVAAPVKASASDVAEVKMTPFLKKQKEKLLALRDGILDSMAGVAKDNLRSRAEGSEASAFGMHQADAGSDAYDRDFALNLLSQEQDALYEIEEALKRLDQGAYGVCEMSGKSIPHPRLEAIPFARYTVECQSQIEKQRKAVRVRQPVTSLFGLSEEESGAQGEGEDEETSGELKE